MAISATMLAGAFTLTFGTAAVGIGLYDPIGSYKFPPSEGAHYLRHNGYNDVVHIGRDYTKACPVVGRRYEATKHGEKETGIVVCLSTRFSPYRPR